MGIVKIRYRGPGNCKYAQRDSFTFTLDDLMQEEGLLLEKEPGDYYDDCELAEVGCEYAMVEDQICLVPYELLDLPDLKAILSLETWNSCLTEDERFSLASYLPDMDQQTFWLTFKELLSGGNIFFGSPLEKLFHRLKGGFYSLQVTRLREGLQFLQRRKYYHSLRSYHDTMTQKFVDMKRAWSNCQPSMSIEERVHIWDNKKDNKPVLLVDLNAIPSEEENLSKVDKNDATIPLLNNTRYTHEEGNTHVPSIVFSGVTVNTKAKAKANAKAKAKGVLKIRPIEMGLMQNHPVQSLPSDSLKPYRRPPKGVLKIKPKGDPLAQQERQRALTIPLEQPLLDLAGVQTSSFSAQYASKWHEESFGENFPFLHHPVIDEKNCKYIKLPELIKFQESLNMVGGPIHNPYISQRKIKMAQDMRLHNAIDIQEETFPLRNNQKMRMYTNEYVGIGDCHNDENLWMNSCQQSGLHCGSSVDSYPSAPENLQGRKQMAPVHDAISDISTVGLDKHPKYLESSDHLEHRHDLNDAGFTKPFVHMAVSGVQREGLMFPITYKRKRPYRKPNQMDSLEHPSMVAHLESVPRGTDCYLNGKAKSVNIKVKGWNEYNGQYN